MNRQEYQDLLIDAIVLEEGWKQIEVPADPLPGETDMETWIRWMLEEEMIEIDEYDCIVIIDADKIRAHDPNMLKILQAFGKADTYSRLDMMEEAGILFTSVDDDGNIIRVLTSTGEVIHIEEDE